MMHVQTYPPTSRLVSLANDILETLWNMEDTHRELMAQLKTIAMALEIEQKID